ncbi:MAG: sulfatase-like hydrolase/transferase [Acidobacteria bacterium]|nr:sulfatase-like hydrolase/transferase [Acidobacteriota bacterium]
MRLASLSALSLTLLSLGCSSQPQPEAEASRPPNIVLVMTDDQGYGDLGVHGNTMIHTPNIDKLHDESIRLTDFHVDPTCSPTRSALMSGRYSSRTGVWHTIMGRSIVAADEVLLPKILGDAGYATGQFGKWHLGDNYPFRPEDKGFQRVVRLGGGGVQQTPDYWGNDYFDDTYWTDSVPKPYQGYCTDVFFNEALAFIEQNKDKPFFVYLPTNAPHGPYLVDEKYSQPYVDKGVPQQMAQFYGMIENIDENVGRLSAKLDELGLRENTILIFMTDNGSAAGVSPDGSPITGAEWGGFNAGMKGRKGSQYDGGHRVPFFLRWPAGDFGPPRDIDTLAAHVDVLPTLAELGGAAIPAGLDLDGRSLAPLLRGKDWSERTLVVHSQRIDIPRKWKTSAVMTERWRLIDGEELYDIEADPGETRDVSGDFPQEVQSLRAAYEAWWDHIDERFDDRVHIPIGSDGENPTRITAHDWLADDDEQVPWNQPAIRKDPAVNGVWYVEVPVAGTYELELYQHDKPDNKTLDATQAWAQVGEQEASAAVAPGAVSAKLTLELPAGRTTMRTKLSGKGAERGAFFVYVKRVGAAGD